MRLWPSLLLSLFVVTAWAEVRVIEVGDLFFRDTRAGSPFATKLLVGDTVRWQWVGGFHTTTSKDRLWDAFISEFEPTFEYTFARTGIFDYFCEPHRESMLGTITVYSPAFTPSASLSVTRGRQTGGGLPELLISDDQVLAVTQAASASPATPNVQIEVTSAPLPSRVEVLRVEIEGRTTGSPRERLQQRVELFDHLAQRWVTIDERNPSGQDVLFEAIPSGNERDIQRFIDTATRTARVRVSVFDRGAASPGWGMRFDLVQFKTGGPG